MPTPSPWPRQEKTAKAYADGKIQPDLVPVAIRTRSSWAGVWPLSDEPPRPGTSMESLAGLKTPFRPHGRVTAGNAAGLNDGATGAVLAAEEVADELGLTKKLRLVSFAFAGVEPEVMGYGPVPSTEKALAKAGLSIDDIGAVRGQRGLRRAGAQPSWTTTASPTTTRASTRWAARSRWVTRWPPAASA
ncbi:MAG: hypothetical protein V9G10_03090 [Candidatus Nanopelagicales bacterium]